MAIKRKVKRSSNSDDITIDEALELFIQEKSAKNLSEATLTNYRQSINYFSSLVGYTDKSLTTEITADDIYKFINTAKLKDVKPSSINHYIRDVRCFLYWCMDASRGYIKNTFKIQEMAKQEEQLKMFTDEEIDALLERPRRNDPFTEWRTYVIVNWVLATGNRAATICNVKISDVNFAHREIVLQHTKNKKAQVIPLSSSLESCLKEYIRMWRKEASIDGWMFPNIGEEQLTTNALRLSFGRYCAARGVEKSNIHGLRHNFAKGWVRNNGNMYTLQSILGHSSLEMTRRYVKLFAEDLKENYDYYSPLDSIKRSSKRTHTVKKGE